MSGTLNNLLGLPMGLGPNPSAQALQANTMGIDPAALGSLYQAINRYALQGTDPGIAHSLLGSAANLYPTWSPMYQLANMQAQRTGASDAAAQYAAMMQQAAPQIPEQLQQPSAGEGGGR